ncbi:MAG: efflux RND transporter periplasmic adaptor subunit, partial [Planctomycetota bacterium]|nr:efflux RND transporter periplasmic adaptor subunit [Planctomycetota bacterium]
MTVLTLVVFFTSCKEQKYFQPPPAKVNVERAEKKLVAEEADFTGRVVAYETVQIRARVSGELKSMSFRPRDLVEAGSTLFNIEPALYSANVEQAKAALMKAKALATEAQIRLDRMETAFKSRAVREVEVIQQRAIRDSTAADVIAAQVALKKTNIDLSYSQVTSPIRGRVSRNYQDIGNLVSGSERTLLAEVVRA